MGNKGGDGQGAAGLGEGAGGRNHQVGGSKRSPLQADGTIGQIAQTRDLDCALIGDRQRGRPGAANDQVAVADPGGTGARDRGVGAVGQIGGVTQSEGGSDLPAVGNVKGAGTSAITHKKLAVIKVGTGAIHGDDPLRAGEVAQVGVTAVDGAAVGDV